MTWKERFEQKRKEQHKESKKKQVNQYEVPEDLYDKYADLSFFQEIGEGFRLYFLNIHKFVGVFFGIAAVIGILAVFIFTSTVYKMYDEYELVTRIASIFSIAGGYLPASLTDQMQTSLTGWQLSLLNRKMVVDFMQAIFKFIPFTVGSILTAQYAVKKVQRKEERMVDTIKRVFKNGSMRTIIFIFIIFNVLISFGLSIMYLPGLLFLMILGFGFFMLPKERFGIQDVIKGSYNYGRDHRLRTFGFIVIGFAFYVFFGNLLQQGLMPFYTPEAYAMWFEPETRNWGLLIYYEVSFLGAQAVFQPLIICFLAVQFVEIGIKKQYNWEKADYLVSGESSIDKKTKQDLKSKKLKKKNLARTLKSKGGRLKYYCPNCGQRITKGLDAETNVTKCAKCGETVYLSR